MADVLYEAGDSGLSKCPSTHLSHSRASPIWWHAADPELRPSVQARSSMSTMCAMCYDAVGGRLVVAPNCNLDVIRHSLRLGMRVLPGVATATEAFGAIDAGARQLKLFPAVKAYMDPASPYKRSVHVLPSDVGVFPVGGIDGPDIRIVTGLSRRCGWIRFRVQSSFRPEYRVCGQLRRRARSLVQALQEARARLGQLDKQLPRTRATEWSPPNPIEIFSVSKYSRRGDLVGLATGRSPVVDGHLQGSDCISYDWTHGTMGDPGYPGTR